MGKTLALGSTWKKPPIIVQRFSAEITAHYWPKIEEQLNLVPHIWEPYWTVDFLYQAVMAGHMQLWGCGTDSQVNLVVWTQVGCYPACKALQVVLALGSEVDEVFPALEAELEHYAKACGCDICEVIGRPGWWGKLKQNGFVKRNECFMRRIDNRSIN